MRVRRVSTVRVASVYVVVGRRCHLCGRPLTTPKLGWPGGHIHPDEIGLCPGCVEKLLYLMGVKLWGNVVGMPDYSSQAPSDNAREGAMVLAGAKG